MSSCSAPDNLNFPWRLIMAPEAIIDYVVIHELAHTVHKNHSARFWKLVRSIVPDWKTHRTHLRLKAENMFFQPFRSQIIFKNSLVIGVYFYIFKKRTLSWNPSFMSIARPLQWFNWLRALACLSVLAYHLNQYRSWTFPNGIGILYQFVAMWPINLWVSFFFSLLPQIHFLSGSSFRDAHSK